MRHSVGVSGYLLRAPLFSFSLSLFPPQNNDGSLESHVENWKHLLVVFRRKSTVKPFLRFFYLAQMKQHSLTSVAWLLLH